MNPIENIDKQQFSPVSENAMSNISNINQFNLIHAEQNYNHVLNYRKSLPNFESNANPGK